MKIAVRMVRGLPLVSLALASIRRKSAPAHEPVPSAVLVGTEDVSL